MPNKPPGDFSMNERSQFSEARAKATAQRIREGVKPVPMFTERPKREGDHVITNIGKPAHA